jgi:hypothetical protein
MKHLAFLRRPRATWAERLAALEAGTGDPGELDGSGGSTAAPSESTGTGTVEPAPSDPDDLARPVDLLPISTAASSEPVGAPAPEPRRRPWWDWGA